MHLYARSHAHFNQKSTSRSSSLVYCKPTERMFYQPYKIRKLFYFVPWWWTLALHEHTLLAFTVFNTKTLFLNCNSRSHFCADHETCLCFSLMKPALTLQSLKSLKSLQNSVFSSRSRKFDAYGGFKMTFFEQRVEALSLCASYDLLRKLRWNKKFKNMFPENFCIPLHNIYDPRVKGEFASTTT